jgi:hypothetical protein
MQPVPSSARSTPLGERTLLGAATLTTALGVWTVLAQRRERKRIRAEREAWGGSRFCELHLTPAGLSIDGYPITLDAAIQRCTVGVEIIADRRTTWSERAATVRAFANAGRPWLLRW